MYDRLLSILVLAFMFSFKKTQEALNKLKKLSIKNFIQKIIESISKKDRKTAKQVFVLNICKLRPQLDTNQNYVFSTYGNQYESFTSFFLNFQPYDVYETCPSCTRSTKLRRRNLTFFEAPQNENKIEFETEKKTFCKRCNTITERRYTFEHKIPFIFIDISDSWSVIAQNLPKTLHFNNSKYTFLSATFYNTSNEHFLVILSIQISFF